MNEEKKVIYSGIKPTGNITVGNYIGALKNWVKMQDDYRCFYNVADLHSITIDIVPAELRDNTTRLFALLLALGIDPDKSTLFVQSHVPAHAELTWILNCYTMFGEGRRMTQFKDKSKKAPQNVNVGLFDYPVLMAADILLYQTDLVPVGHDQLQHVELTRTIAERFNNRYSPTFKLPEGFIPKCGARVYSLQDPTAKMGKSDDNENGKVMLLDAPDAILRKFKRAVTDSGTEIVSRSDKPGISNLLTIYAAFADKTVKEAEAEFAGKSYADFKASVGEAVAEFLRPVQAKYNDLMKNKDYLASLMKRGAEDAASVAYKTLNKVYRKVGFVRP